MRIEGKIAMRTDQLPESIGMCLSGGGFRAAAFHLGVLCYLERAGLLPQVKLMSTVSGGTFTGAKYALSRINHQPFGEFFESYYSELGATRIFGDALALLADEAPSQVPSGRKNLITCAAQVYSTKLFARAPQSPINPQPYNLGDLINGNTAPLEEICFNATDFRRGLAFRFQCSATGWIGNLKAQVDNTEAHQLRIGDIVAASSCFPGGFEPIEFPGDFHWPSGEIPPQVKSDFYEAATPLMDGGVYDNQGLESLLYADARWQDSGKTPADLLIISDTDRKSPDLYALPPLLSTVSKNVWLNLLLTINPPIRFLDCGVVFLHVLSGLAVSAVGLDLFNRYSQGASLFTVTAFLTSIVPLLLALATSIAAGAARNFFATTLLPLVPDLGVSSWKVLRQVRLSHLLDMLNARFTSMKALTVDIFMKRIRAVGFRVFDDRAFSGRLMANYVYHLCDDDRPTFFEKPDNPIEVNGKFPPAIVEYLATITPRSNAVKKLSQTAASVGTYLWFTTPDELETLVTVGQVTTCYNVMKYIARTKKFNGETKRFDGPAGTLWNQLVSDWTAFQTAPNFLAPAQPRSDTGS